MEPGVGGGGAPTLEEDELPRTNFCLLSISGYYHSLKFSSPARFTRSHHKKINLMEVKTIEALNPIVIHKAWLLVGCQGG